jgi:hypothetical protein
MSFPTNTEKGMDETNLRRKLTPYFVEAAYHARLLGDSANPLLQLSAGYFPVKYNPQSRNLGEYLLRSGTYPGYLISGFEIADKKKMLGFRFTHNAGMLTHSLLLASEVDLPPMYDLSVGYLAALKPVKGVDLGAGIYCQSLLAVDDRLTTPALDRATQSSYQDRAYRYVDSLSGDTANYSFSGVKAMGRIGLDPKVLFTSSLFGAEDLKLYAEAAVLGLKNYPFWYGRIRERVPLMVGLNLPAFTLLDVCAFEVEWYGSPYANSTQNIWERRSPAPYTGTQIPPPYIQYDSVNTYRYSTEDNWKWSLYLSRKVAGHLRFSAQVASDHIRIWNVRTRDYNEVTVTPRDWYWAVKMMAMF